MSARYDAAVVELHRAAIGDFVAERKRLAGELKAAGEKDAAAKLSKLARPPISAWAVNQLWWTERDSFDALLDAAARIKAGDRDASKEHREALTALRQRAIELLAQAGNAASEGTLRRITTTLSAIAASGGFAPDPPGALSSDRDPPGFETLVGASLSTTAATRQEQASPAIPNGAEDAKAAARRAEAAAKAEREAQAAARRAEEEARQRRQAERERLSAALKEARQEQAQRRREVERLRNELERAEQDLKQAQALLADIESQLADAASAR